MAARRRRANAWLPSGLCEKSEKEEKDKAYRLVERSYGSFVRSLELPDGVDVNAIKASIDKGVLKVTVPKPAPAQVKKIDVKTAA